MGKGGIQLPDDVIATGYKKVSAFQWVQVFYSPSLNFTGSEQEFINAGHAYRYVQIDSGKRSVIHG